MPLGYEAVPLVLNATQNRDYVHSLLLGLQCYIFDRKFTRIIYDEKYQISRSLNL